MRRLPVILLALFAFIAPALADLKEGGPTGPTGQEVACDLPQSLRTKNVGGRDGSGLCVFTSIGHAARYQNEPRLKDFQQKMRAEPGGGYPEKVDRMIAKYGNGARYIQHQDGDLEFLYQAVKGNRMPSITYDGRDMHYGARQRVAHMVNLVHADPPGTPNRQFAVLDNNFIGPDQLVWMNEEEFKSRWLGMGGGWAVVLLNPPPPPAPRN